MPEQGRFDFNDGARIGFIRRAKLDCRGPWREILTFLGSHEATYHEHFPSLREIANGIGRSVDTVRRAIRELESWSIVKVTECRRDDGAQLPNRCEVNWQKLTELPLVEEGLEGGVAACKGGMANPRATPPVPALADPPRIGGKGGHSSSLEIGKSKPHQCHDMRDENDEVYKSSGDDVDASGKLWLRQQLTKKQLADPLSVERLWKFACRRGWIETPSLARRLWFFGVASYAIRKGKRSAGHCFTDTIKGRFYGAPVAIDERWAESATKFVDFGPGLPRSANLQIDEEAEATKQADETRRKFREQLKVRK